MMPRNFHVTVYALFKTLYKKVKCKRDLVSIQGVRLSCNLLKLRNVSEDHLPKRVQYVLKNKVDVTKY